MKTTFSFSCALALLAVCSAHLCLINPQQRGTLHGYNKAGANDCILLTAPCGGRAVESPTITWNKQYQVTFQKNLSHYNKANPGSFEISLWDSTNNHKTMLQSIPDGGEPSLHEYAVSGDLPHSIQNGDYVLQVTYITNNTPAQFYQCADITVQQ